MSSRDIPQILLLSEHFSLKNLLIKTADIFSNFYLHFKSILLLLSKFFKTHYPFKKTCRFCLEEFEKIYLAFFPYFPKYSNFIREGTFSSWIRRGCVNPRKLIYIREFSRFFNDFLCKRKLRSSSKKSKSFLSPSLVCYPTFLALKFAQISCSKLIYTQLLMLKKWGKKLVRG